MMDPERLRERAAALAPRLKAWRRHLHRHPELSFAEVATQRYVRDELAGVGIATRAAGGTGLVALVGPAGEHCVALRADLDALPIQEVAGRTYGSTVAGVMHACGHDVHTACAMGAALLLRDLSAELPLPVKVLFQPGEEVLPGGATHMIRDGALAQPEVLAMSALHVAPDLPVGTLGTRSGPYMASSDEVRITLRGAGGHGALPHRTVDLVATAAQLVTGLQHVVSRKAPADVPTVLSFGHVATTGGATNVLPVTVELAGTFRTYDEAWRGEARVWIRRIAEATAGMYGAEVAVELREGYPALANDPAVTAEVEDGLRAVFGAERIRDLSLRPTAEDFAWYLRHVPGCFFRLGVGNVARGITAGVHTPEFDVDEDALEVGAVALATAGLRLSRWAASRRGPAGNGRST